MKHFFVLKFCAAVLINKKCSAFCLYVSTREKEYQLQKRGGRGIALVIMNNINIETKSEEEGRVV